MERIVVLRIKTRNEMSMEHLRYLLYEQWSQTAASADGDRIAVTSISTVDSKIAAGWPTEFK